MLCIYTLYPEARPRLLSIQASCRKDYEHCGSSILNFFPISAGCSKEIAKVEVKVKISKGKSVHT